MGKPPVTVRTSDTVESAAKIMIDRNIGCLPVLDDRGLFAGMMTERSFQAGLVGLRPEKSLTFHERVFQELMITDAGAVSAMARGFESARRGPVSDVMVKGEPAATEDMELWQVAELMLKSHLSHIAVLRGGKPVGVIARHDLMRAYAGR
jgi:CBS domain-containing protein